MAQSARRDLTQRIKSVNHSEKPLLEEVILVSQVQNMAKQRVLEALILGIPLLVARRMLFPRFGIYVGKGLGRSFLLDGLPPALYYCWFKEQDKEVYLKLVGIESLEKENRETVEKRQGFINQFWTNSQYWH